MLEITKKIWNKIEKCIYQILNAFFGLCGMQLTQKKFETFMQFIRFGIVGVSNTLISYILYVGSLLLFRRIKIFYRSDYLVAQIIAFVLSVLWSFYWNNKMVFTLEQGKERSIFKALMKTYISYSFTGLFLNSIFLILWVDICGISEFVAPIMNLVISVPLNFIINKFWAFKQK